MPSKRVGKYNILLDENLPPRIKFTKLNSYHHLRHIVHDYGFPGALDTYIYAVAKKNNWLIMTLNIRHFHKCAIRDGPSIIFLSESLSNSQIDTKVFSLLSKLPKEKLSGYFISINNSGNKIEKIRNHQ
jgi:predicted nuclease of predicted toxin-antitoxin system